MRGYDLTCPDGGVETIEASSYQVDDSGGIEFKLGGRTVLSRKSGRWVGVQEFGNRLTTEWPTPKLDGVLQGLMHHLAVTLGRFRPGHVPPWARRSIIMDFSSPTALQSP